jgi:cytosine/adenosine deaminase-related metal-dependent hydrolase
MFGWRRPVSLVNARVVTGNGIASSIRFGATVLGLDDRPQPRDVVIDLDGAFVLPGLVNAHDHLELNHYGPLKRRDSYQHAADWIDDLRPVIREDAGVRKNSAHPLSARLFVGGLKNLLAGTTTVAHHNPLYREIGRSVPVRVVKRFGWAHSFGMEREPVGARGEPGGDVHRRCGETPSELPFIVHACEGVDGRAAGEIRYLQEGGSLRANSLLVHGVALSLADWHQVVHAGAGLIWCPGSNQFLFGRTARVREFLDWSAESRRRICLGSDSRLTGARDLLDELRLARSAGVRPAELLQMVTVVAARLLRLHDAGVLSIGAPADLIVVPPVGDEAAAALLAVSRRDLSLVVIGGRTLVGDPTLRSAFDARASRTGSVAVDGNERIAHASLVRAIARCPIEEPGVKCLRVA